MVAVRENPMQKSGRPSIPVPHLREKLDFLLRRVGQQSKWLSDVLCSPDGTRPAAPRIGGWKKSNRVPVDFMVSLRSVFGPLPEGLLELEDLDAFKQQAERIMTPGTGRYWETLLQRADNTPDSMSLLFDEPPSARLRNLAFSRPSPRRPFLPEVPLDAALRFAIRGERLAGLIAGTSGAAPEILLVCEDRLGWKTFCPRQFHGCFELEDGQWTFPGMTSDPLYLDGEFGLHRVVAVAVAAPLPPPIRDAFLKDKTVWATDALASWLFTTGTACIVLSRRFNSVAAG